MREHADRGGGNVNVCACVVCAIRMRTHSRSNLDQGDAARMIDCFHDVDLVLQRDGVEVGWSRISDWTATF